MSGFSAEHYLHSPREHTNLFFSGWFHSAVLQKNLKQNN